MNKSLTAWLISLLLSLSVKAQNFINYSSHLEEKGETEFFVSTDVGYLDDLNPFFATVLEYEYGITDFWTTELKVETATTSKFAYAYVGYRFENRIRLLSESTFIVPVLYAEYENLHIESPFVQEVVGYAKYQHANLEKHHERGLETRIILGKDINKKRGHVSLNWINESEPEGTKFGYSMGLTYKLTTESTIETKEKHDIQTCIGLEIYGGLGDSKEGLSVDPNLTAHYAGINYRLKFRKGLRCSFGGHIGLSPVSRDYFKFGIGYSF